MSQPIMVSVMLTPEEIEYVLMVLVGMENLNDGQRSMKLREVLGAALRGSKREEGGEGRSGT